MSIDVVRQHILSNPYPRNINLHRIPAEDAARQLIKRRPQTERDALPIGISYHVDRQTGVVDFFCLANLTDVFILRFDPKSNAPRQVFAALLGAAGDEIDVKSLPPSHNPCLVGFGMARTAVQVNQVTLLRVRGVDLSTLSLINIRETTPPSAFIAQRIDNQVDKFEIIRLWMNFEESAERDIALQAWLAACAGNACKEELRGALKVDTRHLNLAEKICLSRLVGQCDLLDGKKPKEVPNEFDEIVSDRNQGLVHILNSRYKTRIRKGDQTKVIITDADGTKFRGNAIRVHGRTTTLACSPQSGKFPSSGPRTMKVFGRPDSTNHEKAREEFIFLVTAGSMNLRRSPFVRMLWFPEWKPLRLEPIHVNPQHAENISRTMDLDPSQGAVVRGMIGPSPIEIVYGPPGTGKTTTIAAACKIWDQLQLPVWVVAHSNVAVKNIAETLFKKRVKFRLLVSKEFHEEWHEHIYKNVTEGGVLMRSDRLSPNLEGMRRLISNSTIILCTLNMLSNPVLSQNGTFKVVPPKRLVIDEASQINVFDLMHLFVRLQKTLEKVCFFGDPMQLPPFGQEDVPSIRTIFDLKHLRDPGDNEHRLRVQYRMPSPIAEFISNFVYGGKLVSYRYDPTPDCLAFIHAPGSEVAQGFSRKNISEIDTIVNLVKNYYRDLNFCVITPYDAQRAAILDRLKREGLPWKAVYNVDSFQGHEKDYVIVSVVRTSRTGFLHSQNRMNVLLTRCKKGLVIVSNKVFLGPTGNGYDTLLDLPGARASPQALYGTPLTGTLSPNISKAAPRQTSTRTLSFLAASAMQVRSWGASFIQPIIYPPSFRRYVKTWSATPLSIVKDEPTDFNDHAWAL